MSYRYIAPSRRVEHRSTGGPRRTRARRRRRRRLRTTRRCGGGARADETLKILRLRVQNCYLKHGMNHLERCQQEVKDYLECMEQSRTQRGLLFPPEPRK